MKTNKPNTRKHRTTCNKVKFRNDANNADAELRATCEAWLCYCVARFIVQREVMQIIITSLQFFFQTIHAWNVASGPWFTNNWCGKTIVRGKMDVGINNVIYTELLSGPKIANGTCGKTIVVGTIDQGSTVVIWYMKSGIDSNLKYLTYSAFISEPHESVTSNSSSHVKSHIVFLCSYTML